MIIAKQVESSGNYEEFLDIVREKDINVIEVSGGDKISIGKNLYFDVLWPDNSNFISENKLNNNALVCKLYYNNFSCIFTGDIEEIAEDELIKIYSNTDVLSSTVLKVAHHGSKSSSTENFLKLVQPKIALIGVGKNNLYGHPAIQIIERLESLRCKNL